MQESAEVLAAWLVVPLGQFSQVSLLCVCSIDMYLPDTHGKQSTNPETFPV